MLNRVQTDTLVKKKFPEFYSEFGETFVDFIEVYYKWLEENKYVGASKELPDILDIDETEQQFLDFFRRQYMTSLPKSLIGNQRLLQKHILDLYRSKGSYDGFRILFRLLYNQEIDIYIPGNDVFKPSTSEWYERHYMEVSDRPINYDFEGKVVKGTFSGATALVETYEKITYNNKKNCLFFVSNINGQFRVGEKLFITDSTRSDLPEILGSVVGFDIELSQPNFEVGEYLVDASNPDMRLYISEVDDANLRGILTPNILDGGFGYRDEGTVMSIDTVVDPPATGGAFEARITALDTLYLSNTAIAPYANTALNAANYDMPSLTDDDINTVIDQALPFVEYPYGPITRVVTTDPGLNYETVVDLGAVDQDVVRLEIYEEDGTQWGNSSSIQGLPSFGANRAQALRVEASLFNVADEDSIELKPEIITSNDPANTLAVTLVDGGKGYRQLYTETIHTGGGGTGATFYSSDDGSGGLIFLSNTGIAEFANTGLGDADYGMPGVGSEDANTVISDALRFDWYSYGSIDKIDTIDAGEGYSSNGSLTITDYDMQRLEVIEDGVYWGNSAVGTTSVENIPDPIDEDAAARRVFGRYVYGPVGYMNGYYLTEHSHASAKKYLQDSFYYQEYSYDIRIDRPLSEYFNILRDTVHPAGVKAFGNFKVKQNNDVPTTVEAIITENSA